MAGLSAPWNPPAAPWNHPIAATPPSFSNHPPNRRGRKKQGTRTPTHRLVSLSGMAVCNYRRRLICFTGGSQPKRCVLRNIHRGRRRFWWRSRCILVEHLHVGVGKTYFFMPLWGIKLWGNLNRSIIIIVYVRSGLHALDGLWRVSVSGPPRKFGREHRRTVGMAITNCSFIYVAVIVAWNGNEICEVTFVTWIACSSVYLFCKFMRRRQCTVKERLNVCQYTENKTFKRYQQAELLP